MRLVTTIDPRPTPWLWGVNGAAGVLAAGLAVASSIGFSIDITIRVGGFCYILLLPFAVALLRVPMQDVTTGTAPLGDIPPAQYLRDGEAPHTA
jgi:hypothetical protein